LKVKSAKSTINTTPPKTYNHLLVKFKKSQVGQLNNIVSWPPDVDISVDYQRKSLKKELSRIILSIYTCNIGLYFSYLSYPAWRRTGFENWKRKSDASR